MRYYNYIIVTEYKATPFEFSRRPAQSGTDWQWYLEMPNAASWESVQEAAEAISGEEYRDLRIAAVRGSAQARATLRRIAIAAAYAASEPPWVRGKERAVRAESVIFTGAKGGWQQFALVVWAVPPKHHREPAPPPWRKFGEYVRAATPDEWRFFEQHSSPDDRLPLLGPKGQIGEVALRDISGAPPHHYVKIHY